MKSVGFTETRLTEIQARSGRDSWPLGVPFAHAHVRDVRGAKP
jgi:hypothetical protein